MENLREETLQLHEVVDRYIVEKNNFRKKIKALEADVADHDRKCEELEDTNLRMFEEHDEKVNDMAETIQVQTRKVDGLRT